MFQTSADCLKVRDGGTTDVGVKSVCCLQARMYLATPPTSAISLSRHDSASSSKRTTLPLWTNWPSRVNHCPHIYTRNSRPT